MPPLSTDLQTGCQKPKDKRGDNAYASRAKYIVWGECEAKKHIDTVNAYNRVRNARPSNGTNR